MSRKINDEVIISELKVIAARNGGLLRPEDVVRAAEPEGSVLHDNFEWDDSAASKQWRLHQARMLINVCVDYIRVDGEDRQTRVFVSLREDRNSLGGYREVVAVMGDAERRGKLLGEALEEMRVFREKYRSLRELSQVFEAIEEAIKVPA